MVEDRITDGKRIGQLLASELTGLERGAMSAVAVVDADPNVEPTDAGAFAYAVEYDGIRVGTVEITPSTARLVVDTETTAIDADAVAVDRSDLSVERDGNETVVVAHSGAAVKGIVDALRAGLEH